MTDLRKRVAEAVEIVKAQGDAFAVEELNADDVRAMVDYITRLEAAVEAGIEHEKFCCNSGEGWGPVSYASTRHRWLQALQHAGYGHE